MLCCPGWSISWSQCFSLHCRQNFSWILSILLGMHGNFCWKMGGDMGCYFKPDFLPRPPWWPSLFQLCFQLYVSTGNVSWLSLFSAHQCSATCWLSRASQDSLDSALLVASSLFDLLKGPSLALSHSPNGVNCQRRLGFPFLRRCSVPSKLWCAKRSIRWLAVPPSFTFRCLAWVFL